MSSKAKDPYKYSILPDRPNSIRLLRLLPASRAEDPIHCRIFNYSLTTPTRTSHLYECLSYVWGSVEDKQTIQVDDAELAVTKNLCGALRRLRDPDLDRVLWVDAVCINQDDLEERASQVQIMAMIYAYASRVVVWLGEEADGSKEAMELLREDASRVYRKQKEYQNTDAEHADSMAEGSDTHDDTPPDGKTPKLVQDQTDSLQNKAILLLQRPWFRRIWVLQEIAAARVMVILCGSDELTGACFFWGLSGLLEWCRDAELRGTVSSMLYLLGDASVLRVSKPTDSEPFRLGICPLSQLVDMFRFREATDPRDKVYALLGIMSQGTRKIDIIPDYGIEWSDLFRKLVHSILGPKVEATWIAHEGKGYGQISAKGCTVGYISHVYVSKSDRQVVSIARKYPVVSYDGAAVANETKDWVLHNSGAAVEQGDIVCWLEGSTGATIIRFQDQCFTIVVAWARFSTVFEKDLFHRKQFPSDHLSHEQWMAEALRLTQYSRDFVLLWPFHTKWKTLRMEVSASSEWSPEQIFSLACIARVLEDVGSREALQRLFEQGFHWLRSEENAPAGVVEHFRDMGQTLPNWELYHDLKLNLWLVLSQKGASSRDIQLDLVDVRRRLNANPELSMELVKKWFGAFSFGSLESFPVLGRVALLLDVWGDSISLETMIELVEHFERISLQQHARSEKFSGHLHTGVIEVFMQLTAQHPDWGIPLAQELIHRAKGGFDRMYCLVRALIVCRTASSEWKQKIVQTILDTHREESFKAKAETSWASPYVGEPYDAAVDFLWRQYILEAKDFVGISPNGTFQLRRELMQEFIDEYRLWKACYDGNVSDVRARAADVGQQSLRMTCKDMTGSWCRVSAIEAAFMNGHVECCKLLLTLFNVEDLRNSDVTSYSVIRESLSHGSNNLEHFGSSSSTKRSETW